MILNTHKSHSDRPNQRHRIVLIVLLTIGLFFLLTEHRAHFFGALPYLLLLACPLMHVFMHGGRHSHEHKEDRS